MPRVMPISDPSDTIAAAKAALRKQAFAARKAAFASHPEAPIAARDHVLASRVLTGCRVIAAYRPIRTELDPTPLMKALCAAGHKLAVPVIQGAGMALKFAEWHPDVEMEQGPFGAEIPVGTEHLVPDLILAPLVAFDRACWRLGYGGGFYDRTLEELNAVKPTRAFGFAFAAQEMPEIPREPTDQPLDGVFTETGLISRGASKP